jgi:hypothetical protein
MGAIAARARNFVNIAEALASPAIPVSGSPHGPDPARMVRMGDTI